MRHGILFLILTKMLTLYNAQDLLKLKRYSVAGPVYGDIALDLNRL